ncbi:MAG: prepilin-type N-terminal cleavage/methylation domain-containing protein [Planctomycetota bacterium]|nr:prepilin-type N-terminal cleavage/methylation domain-containing protein [Planctomycetota bacterium]
MGASIVRRAFTLVELMIVVAIIGVLVALLVPGLGRMGSVADQMRCAENLHRLWQAISLRTADEVLQPRKRSLRATAWPSQLLPYLESGAEFMVCPLGGESLSDSGASAASEENTWGGGTAGGTAGGNVSGGGNDWPASYAQLTDLAQVKVVGSATYYVELEPGQWVVKFSDEQYNACSADNNLNDSSHADQLRGHWDCTYRPGANPHAYWLCVEHGDDDDFKDAMIHVTEQKDGSFSLDISSGVTGQRYSLVSKPEGVELVVIASHSQGLHVTLKPTDEPEPAATGGGGGGESLQYLVERQDDSIANSVVSTSYAMNAYYTQMARKGGKILLMDYTKYLAYVNDYWNDENMDPQQTGIPLFARNSGRMNVLYADGSVVAEEPKDIDPADPVHEMALWDP